jgi:hypothetical protein
MKNPDALRIFSQEFFGGKYKSLKKQQQTDTPLGIFFNLL